MGSLSVEKTIQAKGFDYPWLFHSLIIACSLVSLSCCIPTVKLLPLPAFFLAFYLFFFVILGTRLNIFSVMIVLISCVRYLLIPITYYFSNDVPFNSFKSIYISSFSSVLTLMIFEMLAIFLGLFSGDLYLKKKEYQEKPRFFFGNGSRFERKRCIVFQIMTLVGIVICFLFPKAVSFIKNGKEPNSAELSIYLVSVVCTFLWLLEWISQSKIKRSVSFVFALLFLAVFSILSSVFSTSISRNRLVFNALVGLLLLIHEFPEYKKTSIAFAGVGAFLVFCLITYLKMESQTFSWAFISNTLSKYSQFSMLDSYFAGPVDIEISLNAMNSYNIHGIQWFIYDFFNDIAILGHFFSPTNTIALLNEYIYYGRSVQDIMPSVVQSLIYFSPFLFWIYPFFMAFFPQILLSKSKQTGDIILKYSILCLATLLSMSQIISWNAVSSLWFDYSLPIFILFVLEIFLDALIEKIRLGKTKKSRLL